MSERRLVDTNVIVRHLVQDHPKQAEAASKLFALCDRGELMLVILPAVLAECVFVLESFYKHSRTSIASVLSDLISSPGIDATAAALHLDALNRYAATKLHFVDCTVAAYAAANAMPVATFDTGFGKFSDVRVHTGKV